jgi:hypothetical protein
MKKLVMRRDIPGQTELRALTAAVGSVASLALTGGCIRDAWHGVDHKDIDVAIFGIQEGTYSAIRLAVLNLASQGWAIVNRAESPTPWDEMEDYDNSCDDNNGVRLLEVLSLRTPDGAAVDVLLYNTHFESIEQVLRSHDHTLSQFCARIEPAGSIEAYYLNDYFMGYCWQVRNEVNMARKEHQRTKCAQLLWTYCGRDNRDPLPYLDQNMQGKNHLHPLQRARLYAQIDQELNVTANV